MAIGSMLSGIYNSVEDRYYAVLDWLEGKGITLPWTVNDFLEGKGIPALPFLTALLFIVIAGAYGFLFFNSTTTVSVELSLEDNLGNPLQDVRVQAFNSEGKPLLVEQELSDSGTIELKGVRLGDAVQISVEKEGYDSDQRTLTLSSNSASTNFELKKQITALLGTIQLIDSDTQTAISNAAVTATWNTGSFPIVAYSDDFGKVQLNGIPSNEPITISISANNYEDFQDNVTFLDNETKTISLAALASAKSGKTDVIIRAYEQGSSFLLSNVEIKIINDGTGEEITSVQDADGEYVQSLSKGLSIHVVVSKQGLVSYVSAPLTLRNPEENIKAELPLGSNDLEVTVSSESSGIVIENAIVQVYDEQLKLVETETSSFDGEALFTGLQADKQYYVTAYAQGYLSSRQSITPLSLPTGKNGKQIQIKLQSETFSNSSVLTIFVANASDKPEGNAVISFFELNDEGEQLPLGLPTSSSDELGSSTVKIKNNIHVLAKASKGVFEGVGETTISSSETNIISITLTSEESSIEFNIVNENNLPFQGSAEITTAEGALLFSGPVINGKAAIEALNNKTVTVKLTDIVGNTFTQELSVQGNTSPTIVFSAGKTVSGNSPEVSFVGIFNTVGEEVQGITPDEDYFARIQVKWPKVSSANTVGGVHVRIGDDKIKLIDSQNIGILGFNGSPDQFFYGRSWTPLPVPGNEFVDRQNSGSAGKFSKWLELSTNNPKGVQVFDIRIRARKTISLGEENFFYRAWLSSSGSYSRSPSDDQLGSKSYSAEKLGLYANANNKKILVYETQPVCSGELCTGFTFIQDDGREISPEKFEAIEGRVYALEMEFKHNDVGNIVVNTSTSKENPQIEFLGKEINTFTKFPTAGGNALGEETFTINGNGKARVYFKTLSTEQTSIDITASAGTNILNQTLNFNITKAKQLSIQIQNSYSANEDISITIVNDQGQEVSNAFIQFFDEKGNTVLSTRGIHAPGKGLNGKYVLKNNLKNGIYDVKISADGYSTFEDSVSIGIKGAIELDESLSIKLNSGELQKAVNAKMKNNLSSPLSDLGFELKEIGKFPENLQVQVTLPASINGKSSSTFQIQVNYLGEQTNQEILKGEMELIIHGLNAGKTYTSSSTRLIASYNQQLDDSCLSFNKKTLEISMLDESGGSNNFDYYSQSSYSGNSNPSSSYTRPGYNSFNPNTGYNSYGINQDGSYFSSDQKRTDLLVKNDCGTELSFVPSVIDKQAIQGVNVIVDSSFKIRPGEEKTFHVDIRNKFYREGLVPGNYQYMLSFQNPVLTKNIPLNIQLWNRSFAIDAPQTLEVYLTKKGSEKAFDKVPINMTNIGMADIYNLQANLGGESVSGANIKIVPNSSIQYFPRGANLFPPFMVEVESDATESRDITKSISITGVIDGRRIELRRIDLIIHLSSPSCLQAVAEEKPLKFQSTELSGAIGKTITLINGCLEPVRIASISPNEFGNNKLELNQLGQGLVINPGSQTAVQVLLSKAEAFKAERNVKITGLLVNSQQFVETEFISISIALGDQEVASAKATKEFQIPYCEDKSIAKIRFPIVASGNDCSSAYCDAEQLAQFLAEKIDEKIKNAQQEVNRKKGDLSKFSGCNNNEFCTFAQLGIPSEDIQIYFQNDNLAKELFNSVLNAGDRFSRLKNYSIDYLTGKNAETDFQQRLGTGRGASISIPKFEGCGYYSASIVGAFEVSAGNIQVDQANLLVKLQEFGTDKFRKETGECTQKIQNVQNFLPKDKSLSFGDSEGTYLGVVEAKDPDAIALAPILAKELFGSEDRVQNNTQSNRVSLSIADIDSLAKVEFDPSTSSSTTKKINLIVRKLADPEQQEKIMLEAARAMKGFGASSIGCIGEQENYFKISKVADIGGLIFEGCGFEVNTVLGKLAVRSNESCCELRVASEIPGNASFEISPSTLPGLTNIRLVQGIQNNKNELVKGNEIKQKGDYKLTFNSETNQYDLKAFFCTTADAKTQQLANNKKISLTLTRTEDQIKIGPKSITLQSCQTSPDVALAKAIEKGEGTWTFTSNESKDLKGVITSARGKGLLGRNFIQATNFVETAGDPAYREKDKQHKLKSIGAYSGACYAACIATNGTVGLIAAPFTAGASMGLGLMSCALDCGVPAAFGVYEVYKEDIENTPIASAAQTPIEYTWGNYRDLTNSGFELTGLTSNSDGVDNSMLSAAVLERVLRTGFAGKSEDVQKALKAAKEASGKTIDLDGPGAFVDPNGKMKSVLNAAETLAEQETNLNELKNALAKYQASSSNLRANPTNALMKRNLDLAQSKLDTALSHNNIQITTSPAAKTRSLYISEIKQAQSTLEKTVKTGSSTIATEFSAKSKEVDNAIDALKKASKAGQIEESAVKQAIKDLEELKNLQFKNYESLLRSNSPTKIESLRSGFKNLSSGYYAKQPVKVTAKAIEAVNPAGRVSTFVKSLTKAKSVIQLIGGGVGNIAGYKAFQKEYTKEKEGRITIPASSTESIEQGETYQIKLEKEGDKGNFKLDITQIDPKTEVPSASWIDDCSGTVAPSAK